MFLDIAQIEVLLYYIVLNIINAQTIFCLDECPNRWGMIKTRQKKHEYISLDLTKMADMQRVGFAMNFGFVKTARFAVILFFKRQRCAPRFYKFVVVVLGWHFSWS